MSGQEPAFLQGTQERAAWALLAEQLLPPLPKPAFLAALIRDRWSRELWEQREMAREVLAAEKAWQDHILVPDDENIWRE